MKETTFWHASEATVRVVEVNAVSHIRFASARQSNESERSNDIYNFNSPLADDIQLAYTKSGDRTTTEEP